MKTRLEELEEIEALANEVEVKLATAKAGLKELKASVNVTSALIKKARKGKVKA